MLFTMERLNMVDDLWPVVQIAEGTTVDLPEEMKINIEKMRGF